ncbi:uncharacterized protein si:ch211-80h18.1 [Trichomycterus rosablanca]|uniref:uncharacterized protein si:ch211-80h18.1 n=1 Tax=Trichomycterus rosablanca TaxID=2290929 RepID=UPI002F35F12A
MEGTTQTDSIGGFESFGTSFSPESSGIKDQTSHDFLIGLMGGMGDSFAPDPYTDTIADHMGLAFHVESTGFVLDPGPSVSSSSAPPDHLGPHFSVGTGLDTSVLSTVTSDSTGALFGLHGDMTDGANDNGADLPDINGNGRHRPVMDIHKGDLSGTTVHLYTSEPLGLDTHTDSTGILDIKDPTFSPYTKITMGATSTDVRTYTNITTDAAVTDLRTQTDMTGLAGDQENNGHRQMAVIAMGEAVYSTSSPSTLGTERTGVTEGISNHTACLSQKQILCLRLGLDIQMPHRHILAWFRQSSQSQGNRFQPHHRHMPWAQLQLNLKGLSGVKANMVLRSRHNQLFQQVNSTTHLVRVLKVQKMWNWKIPADFHMKPRVRFLRYRFQCTDQSFWQRSKNPSH